VLTLAPGNTIGYDQCSSGKLSCHLGSSRDNPEHDVHSKISDKPIIAFVDLKYGHEPKIQRFCVVGTTFFVVINGKKIR